MRVLQRGDCEAMQKGHQGVFGLSLKESPLHARCLVFAGHHGVLGRRLGAAHLRPARGARGRPRALRGAPGSDGAARAPEMAPPFSLFSVGELRSCAALGPGCKRRSWTRKRSSPRTGGGDVLKREFSWLFFRTPRTSRSQDLGGRRRRESGAVAVGGGSLGPTAKVAYFNELSLDRIDSLNHKATCKARFCACRRLLF